MLNTISHIYHTTTKVDRDSLNILYFPYDGIFEDQLRCTGFNYYSCVGHGAHVIKKNYAVPEKDAQFNNFSNIVVDDLLKMHSQDCFDLVVCNEKRDQARKACNIADRLHLPLLIIDHEMPPEQGGSNLLSHIELQVPKASRVTTSNIINKVWNTNHRTIEYSIDMLNYHNDTRIGTVMVGDFVPEDRWVIQSIQNSNKGIKIYDGNDNLAKSYGNKNDLDDILLNAKVFVNMSSHKQPPIYMLMAMAAGCVIISNETPWVSDIIKHKDSGLMIDDIDDIKGMVDLLKDKHLYETLQENSDDIIIDRFHNHTDDWISLMQESAKEVYIR